jgi:hypothetical protein
MTQYPSPKKQKARLKTEARKAALELKQEILATLKAGVENHFLLYGGKEPPLGLPFIQYKFKFRGILLTEPSLIWAIVRDLRANGWTVRAARYRREIQVADRMTASGINEEEFWDES